MAKLAGTRPADRQAAAAYRPTPAFADAAELGARKCCAPSSRSIPATCPKALLCAATCAEFGADPARRKGCRAGPLQRPRRGTAGSILRRRPLRQPLDGEHQPRRAGSRPPSARRTRTAHSRDRSRHRRSRRAAAAAARTRHCTPTPSPMSPPASSPAPTKSSPPSPRWNTRSSISKNPAPSRTLSRTATTSSSAPTCSTPWPMCAPRLTHSPRPARSRRHPHVHGRGDAAVVDGIRLRPDQRLVASHRPRSASGAAACCSARSGSPPCSEVGFAETTSLPGLHGPDGGEGQIGVLARKAGRDTSADPDSQSDRSAGREIVAHLRG